MTVEAFTFTTLSWILIKIMALWSNSLGPNALQTIPGTEAVLCSPFRYVSGGVGFGGWLTGKLGHAWVGAWHLHGCMVGGGVVMMW